MKSSFTSESDLYIVHTSSAFTPGCVARVNGESKYKDYLLKRGFVHLTLERINENGKVGGTIYPKAMWPQSTSFTTTISTSTSTTSSLGRDYSAEIGDGASLKSANSYGLTFSFDKSVSSISSDPRISAQFSSESIMEAQWNFEVINRDMAGKTTFSFEQYFLFEMKKDANGCNSDAFIVNYSVNYQGQYQGFLWAWYDGWSFDKTTKITCFM